MYVCTICVQIFMGHKFPDFHESTWVCEIKNAPILRPLTCDAECPGRRSRITLRLQMFLLRTCHQCLSSPAADVDTTCTKGVNLQAHSGIREKSPLEGHSRNIHPAKICTHTVYKGCLVTISNNFRTLPTFLNLPYIIQMQKLSFNPLDLLRS